MKDKCKVEFHGQNAEGVTTAVDVSGFPLQVRHSEEADYTPNDRRGTVDLTLSS